MKLRIKNKRIKIHTDVEPPYTKEDIHVSLAKSGTVMVRVKKGHIKTGSTGDPIPFSIVINKKRNKFWW
ncbi:hypothetical protein [Limosilactobacillus fastidiosus]|uniref:Uncharacterized protein n=1 Tax=Limosilactobacillus fastidiosus TaxID=2759855 RepID=A0A7W3TY34_9LACO|nr:hypothetical protein [Limosilactobacillus fastidiosus]MBB1063183.1 hypothetical protein [Limosilactobacillus fastidiosus]MBB1085401.1 hypothetical protein [Limosilactobacillus fastidiosus]MCD7083703.1 hypothetical protein [Limosilactobacillus fastidiosus]MCD7085383.1 hypothetical protein [Limosilactobacillus fastidiosus]MCD7114852.1 hypothetical protein [Limosilactobacillus fastidiosus]